MKSAKKFNFITPRDFLDFIRHFISTFNSKKMELVEQQSHLNRGLDKIIDSEEEVKKLQGSLKVFQEKLVVQEKAASEKLVIMMDEKNKAEKKKDLSKIASKNLEEKQVQIRERKVKVDEDLGKAEPALVAAQESVNGLKKKDLNEMRSYAKPPESVRMTLEPVCILMRGSTKLLDWKEIKAEINRDDFIRDITNFDKDQISPGIKKFILEKYINDEATFDVKKIEKASKAAGPLALWVKSIIEYSEIFHSIAPLREELAQLTEEEGRMKEEKIELDENIEQLEKNIEQYSKEYAMLIAQVEGIKNDKKNVEEKVQRSLQLIHNLSSERLRWEESSKSFVD